MASTETDDSRPLEPSEVLEEGPLTPGGVPDPGRLFAGEALSPDLQPPKSQSRTSRAFREQEPPRDLGLGRMTPDEDEDELAVHSMDDELASFLDDTAGEHEHEAMHADSGSLSVHLMSPAPVLGTTLGVRSKPREKATPSKKRGSGRSKSAASAAMTPSAVRAAADGSDRLLTLTSRPWRAVNAALADSRAGSEVPLVGHHALGVSGGSVPVVIVRESDLVTSIRQACATVSALRAQLSSVRIASRTAEVPKDIARAVARFEAKNTALEQAVAKHRSRIETLEVALRQEQHRYASFKTKAEKREEAQKAALHAAKSDASGELHRLQEQVQVLRRRASEAEAQVSTARQAARTAASKLRTERSAARGARATMSPDSKSSDGPEGVEVLEISRLKKELDRLAGKARVSDSHRHRLEGLLSRERKAHEDDRSNLMMQLRAAERRVRETEDSEDKDALRRRVHATDAELASLQEKLDLATAELKSARQAERQVASIAGKSIAAAREAGADVAALRGQLAVLHPSAVAHSTGGEESETAVERTSARALHHKLDAAEARAKRAEQRFEALRESSEKEEGMLRGKVNEERTAAVHARAQLADAETTLRRQTGEMERLQGTISALREQLAASAHREETLRGELSRLRAVGEDSSRGRLTTLEGAELREQLAGLEKRAEASEERERRALEQAREAGQQRLQDTRALELSLGVAERRASRAEDEAAALRKRLEEESRRWERLRARANEVFLDTHGRAAVPASAADSEALALTMVATTELDRTRSELREAQERVDSLTRALVDAENALRRAGQMGPARDVAVRIAREEFGPAMIVADPPRPPPHVRGDDDDGSAPLVARLPRDQAALLEMLRSEGNTTTSPGVLGLAASLEQERGHLERAHRDLEERFAGLRMREGEAEAALRLAQEARVRAEEAQAASASKVDELRVALAARPTAQVWKALQAEVSRLEHIVEAASEAGFDVEALEKRGRSLSAEAQARWKHERPGRLAAIDRKAHKLGLDAVLPAAGRKELEGVVAEACAELELADPLALPAAIRAIKKAVASLPPLEAFVADVFDRLVVEDEAAQGGGALFDVAVTRLNELLDNTEKLRESLSLWEGLCRALRWRQAMMPKEAGELSEADCKVAVQLGIDEPASVRSLPAEWGEDAVRMAIREVASLVKFENISGANREALLAAEAARTGRAPSVESALLGECVKALGVTSFDGLLPAISAATRSAVEYRSFLRELGESIGLGAGGKQPSAGQILRGVQAVCKAASAAASE
jgi:hypothetical protein